MPHLQPANAESTRLFREAAEAAAVVETQLARNAGDAARVAADLVSRRKSAIVTLARCSSDHAATSVARGYDLDRPRYLSKITETL